MERLYELEKIRTEKDAPTNDGPGGKDESLTPP